MTKKTRALHKLGNAVRAYQKWQSPYLFSHCRTAVVARLKRWNERCKAKGWI